eukprot:TRINITY_DN47936_c0_g1_i1.p2 TRINITY_DN47936_c0_g1~~TRINITY_DN47936_c0_g1_i1.p2  ORF type:complete len:254 (+),score=74.21 TRINITY_DN47936_c0_g1_i1:72-764(+)
MSLQSDALDSAPGFPEAAFGRVRAAPGTAAGGHAVVGVWTEGGDPASLTLSSTPSRRIVVLYTDMRDAVWERILAREGLPGGAAAWRGLRDAVTGCAGELSASQRASSDAPGAVQLRAPGGAVLELRWQADRDARRRRVAEIGLAMAAQCAQGARELRGAQREIERRQREADAAAARIAALEARCGAAPHFGVGGAAASPATARQGAKREPPSVVDPAARRKRPRGVKFH